MPMIKFSDLDGNLRLAHMIENEVRAILADTASIRNSGALLYGGDVANIGSDSIRLRYANWGAATPFTAVADGADATPATFTPSTVDLTVGRYALRYDITDLAVLSGLGQDVDPFSLAAKMAESSEACINDVICQTFTGATKTIGTSGVNMSVDDFFDAMFYLELGSNDGSYYSILHPQQLSDLVDSLRGESNNAMAYAPATAEMMKIKGQGYAGSMLGVDIFKSSYVTESGGNKIGAMLSRGGLAYVVGTPRPLAGAGAEIRPAGTPVVVAFQRDESAGLTEIIGHLYCGAALVEQARICKIVTDA